MKVHFIHLSKSIATKKLQKKSPWNPILTDPLVFQPEKGKYVVVCKFGVVVFWGLKTADQKVWIKRFVEYLVEPMQKPVRETSDVLLTKGKEGIKNGDIVVKKIDGPRAALIALILGQSLALEHYESEVEKSFEDFGKVTKTFAQEGRMAFSMKNLLKKVAFAMHVQHMTVSRVELLDRPNLIWEDVDLAKLYDIIREEYELDDRYEILNEKLRVMFQNVEFILNMIESHRTILLEIIIVVLILIEVVLFVYEIWW